MRSEFPDTTAVPAIDQPAKGYPQSIDGFTTISELFRGENSLVLRARRDSDGRAVVLKTPAAIHAAPEVSSRLVREYRLGHGLDGVGAIEYLELRSHQGNPLVVLEDFGGALPRSHRPAGRGPR